MKRLTRVFPIIASLFGAALFAACTEATAPDNLQFAKAKGQAVDFTRCERQPAAHSSGWIGPKGGVLRAGRNVFRVPPGALKERVFITMETTDENFNHVVFGPEGLVFNSRSLPTLVMSYQNCVVASNAQQRVAYVNEALDIIEPTPSRSDPVRQTVEGQLSHFSDYVLLSTYAVVY
jgi:hypothetical protein